MLEIMKLDDQIYIEEGFRKEQIDKAIVEYGIDEREIGRESEGTGLGALLGRG